jgi:hypothetical protein
MTLRILEKHMWAWISGNSSLYNPKYAIFFGHLLVMLVQIIMANCTNAESPLKT